MTSAAALGSDSRTPSRRRSRSSVCAQVAAERAIEGRVAGVPAGGGLTLGQLLDGVWEGLHAGGAAACPVCRAEMSTQAAGTAARCEGCGAVLA